MFRQLVAGDSAGAVDLRGHGDSGWTIGGGLEYLFTPNWSAFVEYNYMDFGSKSGTVVTPAGTFCAGAGCSWSANATESNVLVGVNYRFF